MHVSRAALASGPAQPEIRPTAGGARLVLTSTHRLSTPFNWYTGLCSEWVMDQIQGSILSVIKHRSEAAAG